MKKLTLLILILFSAGCATYYHKVQGPLKDVDQIESMSDEELCEMYSIPARRSRNMKIEITAKRGLINHDYSNEFKKTAKKLRSMWQGDLQIDKTMEVVKVKNELSGAEMNEALAEATEPTLNLGMSPCEVIIATGYKPSEIDVSTNPGGARVETWRYRGNARVSFANGSLVEYRGFINVD